MVIRFVSHCHALLLQSATAFLVDLHSSIDGGLSGVLTEYAAHLVEHPKDSCSYRYPIEVVLMINEILCVDITLRCCLRKIAQSLLMIRFHFMPQQIEFSQCVLRKLIALRSRIFQMPDGGIHIFRNILCADEQQLTEAILCVLILLRCRFLQPASCLRKLALLSRRDLRPHRSIQFLPFDKNVPVDR